MKITKRKETFTELVKTTTIRFSHAPAPRFCAVCDTETIFVTAYQAAFLAQMTDREIFRQVEAAHLHASQTAEGFLLVCLASLQNAGKEKI